MVYNWLKYAPLILAEQNCFLCGHALVPASSSQFCPECAHDLPKISPACSQCGIGLPQNLANIDQHIAFKCGPCLTEPPTYDRVVSAYAYATPIKQLIAQFKYQHQLAVGAIFADILVANIMSSPGSVEAILPVPLHKHRLRQRGFNQALELARPVARALKLPLLLTQISRQKNTMEQSSLSGKQRRTNLNNAFVINRDIPYKSIAIVDDVMTTGSTVEELSCLLKRNGVDYVEVWCLARASIN